MKKTILLFALTGLFLSTQAQTSPVPQQEKPVTITLLPSQLNVLQQILQFSYQWLPKSDASAKDVNSVLPEIQKLYPLLVPVADTTKRLPVVVKKGGE